MKKTHPARAVTRDKATTNKKIHKSETSLIYGDLNVAISIQRHRSDIKNLLSRRPEAKMPFLSELLPILAKFLPVIVQINKCMRRHISLLCCCTTEINKHSSGMW